MHPRLLLSLIFLAWTTGAASAFSLGLSGLGEVRMSAGQGFGPKLQYGGGGSIDMGFPVLPWLDLGGGFDLYGIAPSDVTGGFSYRGFAGGALSVDLEAHARLGSWKGFGQLDAGGGVEAAGVFAGYTYTTLYFYYPELTVKAFLDYVPSFLPAIDVRLSLPVSAQFRADMTSSVSAGIELGLLYRFGSGK